MKHIVVRWHRSAFTTRVRAPALMRSFVHGAFFCSVQYTSPAALSFRHAWQSSGLLWRGGGGGGVEGGMSKTVNPTVTQSGLNATPYSMQSA